MRFTRHFAAALVALATVGGANTAQAQITYTTSGVFSGALGCSGSGPCTNAANDFQLSYVATPTQQGPFASGYIGASLGKFLLTLPNPAETFSLLGGPTPDLIFTLTIHQTNPGVPGSQSATSNIDGTITVSNLGPTGGLIWTPVPRDVQIGDVTYHFNNESYVIGGQAGQTVETSLSATVATPEPASMTLLATGLVGIFGAARRRKKMAA